MKHNDKQLLIEVIRMLPRIVLAVCLIGVGAVLLILVMALLLSNQHWAWNLLTIPYLWWSIRRLKRWIGMWAKPTGNKSS